MTRFVTRAELRGFAANITLTEQASVLRTASARTHIGEWHSHPELRPTPSVIDRASWLKSRREQRRPLAFLIVGTADVCVCADAELGTIRALVPIDQDEMGVLFGHPLSDPSRPVTVS